MYGLVKVIDDGQGGKIKLVGNALTFIIYKNYFGKDLLNDIVSFAKNNASAGTVQKLSKLKIQTVEDLAELSETKQAQLIEAVGDFQFDSEFCLNFIAALMATAQYPKKPDIIDIIMEIPPQWIADKNMITDLMEFLSLFISAKKAAETGGNSL